MRIFGIGCSHGKLPNLKRFVRGNNVDVIFSLGDHCNANETRNVQFKNWEKFKGKDYYKVMQEILGERYETVFRKLAESGKRILKSLDKLGLPVYVIEGNNEFTDRSKGESGLDLPTLEDLIEDSSNLNSLISCFYRIGGYALVGAPGYRGMNIKNKESKNWKKIDKRWNEDLKKLFSYAKGYETLFIGHDIPYGCKLDVVNYPASPMHGKHVGDEIIKKYIIKNSPKLYLGSHMHEWQGSCKIGKTTVVSSGYGREGKGVLIDLPSFEIKFVKV
jgi:Icc-related predicted phosphoesterase